MKEFEYPKIQFSDKILNNSDILEYRIVFGFRQGMFFFNSDMKNDFCFFYRRCHEYITDIAIRKLWKQFLEIEENKQILK